MYLDVNVKHFYTEMYNDFFRGEMYNDPNFKI